MTLYVDSSALLKRYVDEHDSDLADELLRSDPVLVTTRLTEVEVRRNLARLLDGDDLERQRRSMSIDLDAFAMVGLDAVTMGTAARIAEQTLCRSLDSIHLAAAQRCGTATVLATFDVRQAAVARRLGMAVVGV
ncbi:MAG: type II toxin-antitoxin system VapC family toxin [Ilumatobacteraceae bacterium]